MKLVNLRDAIRELDFGGKAANLSKGLRAGLPIPEGFALDTVFVKKVLEKDNTALNVLNEAFNDLNAAVAVRSSAIGEDSKNASFAGQYLSKLNIKTFTQLIDAIEQVAESALADSIISYRKKLGLSGEPLMAIVIQKLVNAGTAGVMFSRNPITKVKEYLIEAAWGIGEAVVAGLVIPDFFKLNTDGSLLESKIGIKDRALYLLDDGGTEEIPINEIRSMKITLNSNELLRLYQLAIDCEKTYGQDLDIEWGLVSEKMYLLQCRSITT